MTHTPALLAAAAAALLSACAAGPMTAPMASKASMAPVDNAALPEAVRVPAGQMLRMSATGVGEITYECREKAGMAGAHEWAFVAPVATLYGAGRQVVGTYYAGPTWQSTDGSKVTGKQLAVAPAGAGRLPLQLVKAEPAMGSGAMQGVSYIQRLNTKGGVAPTALCDASAKGQRQQVAYEADYVFYGS
jgi:Protein of unknown function (DUF3455)